jgi:hypothetical protein
MNRRYRELLNYTTFEDRFNYLALHGRVGERTFGFDRWVNQRFYTSSLWHQVRNEVIIRDQSCDLGVPGYEIHHGLLIHHMNPIEVDDILHGEEWILDPEFLITTTQRTHNAIHYGDANLLPNVVTERRPGDTQLW